METLALLGGEPVLRPLLPHYNSIGQDELEGVLDIIKSGTLSGFYGSWGDQFLGGPAVRAFEGAWCERFGVNHAISMNSATSGLFAAMGAIGVAPGDEVIVPPYTMSATAMAPLIYGGIPIFVDIEPDTFCLDPRKVREAITSKTKAILAVNLFGHPAPLHELMEIAREYGLMLIEDNAQGPTAREHGRYAGTIGHMGIFSLNYHKHIHTGEGGMCVTNDDQLALKLQMIRNHAENIVEHVPVENISNLIGFNYRMTELSAAVGIAQLKNMDLHVERRKIIAQRLTEGIEGMTGLTPPKVRMGCHHVYYLWALRVDEDVLGISRRMFSRALAAEGFPHFTGYVRPLYMLPLFQQRIAFGSQGYPFSLSNVHYRKGLCPVTELMHEKELLCFETCLYDIDEQKIELLVKALRKVYGNRTKLANLSEE
ncbi:MAG: DegT/DnrJ/EryC1/StrS family aminotransferase [Nitrospirota bacterium]